MQPQMLYIYWYWMRLKISNEAKAEAKIVFPQQKNQSGEIIWNREKKDEFLMLYTYK